MESNEWEHIGRQLLHDELGEQRFALSDAFYAAEEALATLDDDGNLAGELDREHILELRHSLNSARLVVETYAARTTDDVEPWGDPLPDMPHGVHQSVFEK